METVVLLTEDGRPSGTMPKALVHSTTTPLHLAFSCYLFDASGRLLLTRRALSKATWPGVWTNSFCGHPAPDESMDAAIARRAQQELGCAISDIEVALPSFRYRAVDAGGIVENEVCPVYFAQIAGDLQPDPDEVTEWQWAPMDAVITAATSTPFAFSPWMVEQLGQLARTPVTP